MERFFPYILCLISLTALPGCPISITCEDLGCPLGQRCSLDSGECVPVSRQCSDDPDICRADEVCDVESGECRPERLQCTEQFTCPDGQSCNASSGFCEPAFRCESNADCGTAERCDDVTQQCDPLPCTEDDACPASYICGGENTCSPGCRPGTDGCRQNQFCRVLSDATEGRCVPNCTQDTDCPYGQFCALGAGTASSCVKEPPCLVDSGCRLDEVCLDGTCAQPPCSSNGECLETQLCDTSTGTCRSATCDDDNFGQPTPNDSLETAFGLEEGTYTQLTLCPGRSDWFALDARSSDIILVRLQKREVEPDLDLFIYDADGNPLVANQQPGAVSSVKFGAGRDQVVFIEIRGREFESSSYDLTITTEPCRNDPFEENDSIAEATSVPSSIGVPTELALLACGFDEDWFRLPISDDSNGLRVERVSGTPDLRVDLFTPDGEILVVERDVPVTMLHVGTAGDYLVRAYGALGQAGSYRLAFETLPPWNCPGLGEHAAAAQAAVVPSDATYVDQLCPAADAWEIDWLALPVDQDGVIDVTVIPSGGAPSLDVTLLRGDGAELNVVRNAVVIGEAYRLEAAVTATEQWYLRVSSPETPGRVIESPMYEVAYSVR